MNTLFTNRLNGVFILNTLLEMKEPVKVSTLAAIINRRYESVTAPDVMVSVDTVRRFLNDFYQTTEGTDYSCFKLVCFKKGKGKTWQIDHDVDNVMVSTYIGAYIQTTPQMNIRKGGNIY